MSAGGGVSARGMAAQGVSTWGGVCQGGGCQGLPGMSAWGYLPRGCLPSGGVCPTPPSPCEQNDTGVKTLPYRNYVADGNKSVQFYISQFLLVYVSVPGSSSVNTSLRSIDRMITCFNVRKPTKRTNIAAYYTRSLTGN